MNTQERHQKRCDWNTSNSLYIKYHDTEWGLPVYDDQTQFEFLILESAQSGLSWNTILQKRVHFHVAYDNFDYHRIAAYDEEKIAELMNNPTIIRNKRKIRAAINNAQRFIEIQKKYGSFSYYLWKFVDFFPIINHWKHENDIPAQSLLSQKICTDMRKKGFTFLGPIIVYSHLQATGLINDHIVDCFCYKRCIDNALSPDKAIQRIKQENEKSTIF